MIEPPVPEEALVSEREKALKAEMIAFMDELTMLTRRTCVVISSNGDTDVTSLRRISQEQANQGRYVFFWSTDENSEGLRYPVDMFWDNAADVDYLVNFDMVGKSEAD
jgi:hypothetical protein